MVLPRPGMLYFASKSNKTMKMAGVKKLQIRACIGRAAMRACRMIFALSMRKYRENSLNLLFNFIFRVEKKKKTPNEQRQRAKMKKNFQQECGKAPKMKC